MKTFFQYDYQILKWIQTHRFSALDTFFYGVSATTFLVCIMVLVSLGWLYIKRKPKAFNNIYYSLLFVFTLSAITSLVLKYIINRPRPFVTHPDIITFSQVSPYAFPSGHTTIVFSLAFLALFLALKKRYLIPLFLWAILVAYSRMVLGAHYLSDVLGGIVISVLLSILMKPISKKWPVKKT
ncbi:phosphatase PAP2 family protein [Lacinutrix undariae]